MGSRGSDSLSGPPWGSAPRWRREGKQCRPTISLSSADGLDRLGAVLLNGDAQAGSAASREAGAVLRGLDRLGAKHRGGDARASKAAPR